jgi:uncharacterized protein YlbG (UPF0298 family)
MSISLLSCNKTNLNQESEDYIKYLFIQKISLSHKVIIDSPKYFNNKDFIDHPAMTTQKLARFYIKSSGKQKVEVFCLQYKIPFKNEKHDLDGVLKLLIPKDENCLKDNKNNEDLQISNIRSLKVYFTNKLKKAKRNRRKTPTSYKNLVFEIVNSDMRSYSIKIPLPNIPNRDDKRKKFKTLLLPSEGSEHLRPEKLTGSWEDTFLNRTSKICHFVNDQCDELLPFKCDECRYGWYEVEGDKCPTMNTKYCGVNNCGSKGNPACLRGTSYLTGQKIKRGCYINSKSVFCNDGLLVTCGDNNVLICD